ncbi:MAG: chitobiase/beta-hexosaminidase C-terminal domain-containing protein [Lachnospiraceae bacterium]|nr:chitobiase/beta-hexosaminidase C-terminal domain-containing protein [Lachnospiraceae bacterium]
MMICPRCGSEIPDGKLYCPHCGYEVHLVPDYTSVSLERERLLREQAEEKLRLLAEAEKEARMIRRNQSRAVRRVLLILILALALTAVMVVFIAEHSIGQFRVLKQQAEAYYAAGSLDEAEKSCDAALRLRPGSTDLNIMKAEMLIHAGEEAEAEEILRGVIERDREAIEAYEVLLAMLAEKEDTNAVAELVRKSGFEKLMEQYEDYLVDPPVFSLVNGNTYTLGTKLSILGSSGTIYYTVDGTVPDETSAVYEEPIQLVPGSNTISAICINDRGTVSKVVKAVYNVRKAA